MTAAGRCVFLVMLMCEVLYARAAPAGKPDSGGWSGNGGGLYQVNDNVWYLGSEAIRYCVRVGEGFPLPAADVEEMIRRGFRTWQQFFSRYQIGSPSTLNGLLPGYFPHMTLVSREVACADKPELEFYIGLDNEELRLYRSLNESDGYGLALRRSYDHARHRQQGYVWIPAFSQDARKIEHMLLHELGHIFGMKHDTVFVMDRHVALTLKKITNADAAYAFLGKVEADFWPFDMMTGSQIALMPEAQTPGCSTGSFSLGYVPYNFHPRPPMRLVPCARLHLQRNSEALANNFQLNMTNENGQWLQTIFGTFQMLEAGDDLPMVPGTLSTWQNVPRTPMQWVFVPYALRNMHTQLSGYFIVGMIRYPARISWKRGLSLEIFIPDQARWWVIHSV
ncbi:hypothetical protein [Oligoflexus tunisiensis]|uniref:hypothetical protein n=1 Tax=Oligoflexus tunisiensis TaxID=708132 RepID=UPI00114C9369|nr:hypothetical protein [Oligoflexus tunisiensis]